MSRILYPVLTEPVLTAAQQPEQVTESRWHQPLSQPVLRAGLSAAVFAAGLFWSGFTPAQAETVTLDKWYHPLEQPAPIPRRLAENPGLAYSYAVIPASIGGWGQPLAQPALPKGPAAALIEASGETWAPRLPDLSLLWQQPLSLPRTLVARQFETVSFVYAPPVTPVSLEWAQPLSLPTARVAPQLPEEVGPLFVSASIEWFQPLSTPQPRRRATEYQALSYGYFVTVAPPETITVDKWLEPLSVPVRWQRVADYPALSYSYAIVSAPPVSAAQTAIHGNILTPTRWIMGR